jgi:isopenicillin-N epimerase
MASPYASHWFLDPAVSFLNHGSFGATPRPILAAQQRWRDRLERQPVRFFARELEPLLDEARTALADFIGAPAADLVFVPNATAGVNAVLRSLSLAAGDELLTTDHAYNACRNTLEYVAGRSGARVVAARVPFPLESPEQVVEAVLEGVTSRTRLALIDHVTSPTGLVFPIKRLVRQLSARGVDSLVDGAHAPGMVPLRVAEIGAAYYVANCHKWLCAPKGAGFLHVRPDRQPGIHPTAISHGLSAPLRGRSRFHLEFDWTGTDDPTPYLCVPEAIRFLEGILPGGWPALMAHNHALAVAARQALCEALEIEPPCPESMLGALAALPLPDGSPEPPASSLYLDPLQDELLQHFGIEVPVVPWPAPPRRLVRISAQVYNDIGEYERLARALSALLRR